MIARLRDVAVRHGDLVALDTMSLEVQPRTLTAIVGGDGAGKTSLLRVLAGATSPSSGEVTAPARERIGYVAAGSGTYPDLTVVENLRFSGTAYGLRDDRFAHRMEALLEVTALAGARDRLAAKLSGGMRQKLAFACATIHRPDLLVMDEPTTGVDPVSRSELWRLVASTQVGGTATVFATTYLDEAARADQVLVLDRGRLIAAGSPDKIRREVPGRVVVVRDDTELPTWRRGRTRHGWIADGNLPDGAEPVDPDLEDAVVVAALAALAERARTPEVQR